MRLTSFTDYGLRALMRLASTPDRSFSTAELADEFVISRSHLTKIMTALAQAGIVTTRRGSGGGAMLARPPGQIRLGDVVRVLETDQPLVECFSASGGECTISGRCRLKGLLRTAELAFLGSLDQSTLADVALAAPSRSNRTRGPGAQSAAGRTI